MPAPTFVPLDVAVIGGGLGGLSAAVSLRRAGHRVSIYERYDFNGEVGASISCAANGTQWLVDWKVNIAEAQPVILKTLIMRDWKTGRIENEYKLDDYEEKWGNVYNMFHRQDMHQMLLRAATSEEGQGTPAKCYIEHRCESVDCENGIVKFENGVEIKADLIVGADGIRSKVRSEIGVTPEIRSAPSTCFRCNIPRSKVEELGLEQPSDGIEFWGGYEAPGVDKWNKIVMAPCHGGELISFYCFMPTEMTTHRAEGFRFAQAPVKDLIDPYPHLDPRCFKMLEHAIDIMPWRLYYHKAYPHWVKGRVCILGDAAHPCMPHQSQGACQAIEDAAALGIIFSSEYSFSHNVVQGLKLYEAVRKPRGTRVQDASARATENLNERIGFSSLSGADAKIAAAQNKLTIDEMNLYKMEDDVRAKASQFV